MLLRRLPQADELKCGFESTDSLVRLLESRKAGTERAEEKFGASEVTNRENFPTFFSSAFLPRKRLALLLLAQSHS